MDDKKEKIEFQYVMNYKAYRRKMISLRLCLAVIIAGGACGLCAISIVLGVILAAGVLCIGVFSVLISLGNEQTYTVYNTRIVIKRRNKDTRTIVPFENMLEVHAKRSFYEKDLGTSTVIVTAKDEKGKTKKYKLRHIFDAEPVVKYLNSIIQERNTNESRE